jgi:hypothetical protein
VIAAAGLVLAKRRSRANDQASGDGQASAVSNRLKQAFDEAVEDEVGGLSRMNPLPSLEVPD